jgi:nucleotide-binding universal stress UspA family protein
MYRHILIPTDGSELAEHGVAHGLALAKSLEARVSVIFVVEPFSEMTGRFLEAVATYAELRKEQATSVGSRGKCGQGGWCFLRDDSSGERANPIKPSSQQPRTEAAISLLCHRMGAADFPCF